MVARRTEEISSFIVMDVLEKACEMEAGGQDVIHLEVGEPDFDTPACIKAAACAAMDQGHTHYCHSLGLPELRQAVSDYYHRIYAVDVDPDDPGAPLGEYASIRINKALNDTLAGEYNNAEF